MPRFCTNDSLSSSHHRSSNRIGTVSVRYGPITGVGGVTHSPGMVAAMTVLPVIGVSVDEGTLAVALDCWIRRF